MKKMSNKSFWHTSRIAFVLKNLIAALVVGVVLLVVLIVWLRSYTQHGVEVEIPSVTGMYMQEALPIVEGEGLRLVVIDSTYSRKVPLGTIVEQNPPAGSHAKLDRAIYVTVNASTVRQIVLPELHDISYRQAEATLRSLGILVSGYVYEPSEYKDLVLDIRQGDKSIEVGERVAEGSAVTLVVGRGKGTGTVDVPSLQGRSLVEVRSLLLANYLTLGAVMSDIEATEEVQNELFVYWQEPAAGTNVQEGTRVDVRLTDNVEKAITSNNTDSEEEFF